MRRTFPLFITGAWIGLIFYLGTIPTSFDTPEPDRTIDFIQKFGHFGTHLVLAALVYLVLSPGLSEGNISKRAALIAMGFTVAVGILLEILQLFAPTRTFQVLDMLFDGIGAVTGILAVFVFDLLKVNRAYTNRATVSVALFGIILLSSWTIVTGSAGIPRIADCKGLFGSPATATISSFVGTLGPGERVTDGLVVLYDFNEGSGIVVHDKSNVEPFADLEILDPSKVEWVLGPNGIKFTEIGSAVRSGSAASKVYESITASNELTVEAWVTPASLSQKGPVRIVVMSEGTHVDQVNFHLGQSRTAASFRLRTVCHSSNTTSVPDAFADTDSPRHVVVTFDGVSPHMFFDGEAQDLPESLRGDYRGDFSDWDPGYPLVIGNEATLDRPYLGTIHLIAIYNRALSSDEIKHNFAVGLRDDDVAR